MHRTLRFQLIVIVVTTVVLVLSLLQWFNTRLSEDALERDAEARALLALHSVGSISRAVDAAELRRDLSAIVEGDREIVALEVLRLEGGRIETIVAVSEKQRSPVQPLTPQQVARLAAGARLTESVRIDDVPELMLAVPLLEDSRVFGVARVWLRNEAIGRLKSRLRGIDTAMLLVSTLLITAVLAWFLERRVGHPVASLVEGMRRAEAGELDVRVAAQIGSEFGFLTSSFNRMLSRIEELTTGLEERVHAATQDLEDKNRELQHVNDQLWHAQAEIARTERLATLGQMAGTLAHELGTPLNTVLGYVQLLERTDLRPEQGERLKIIEAQVRRMVDLIRSVLDRTRDAPVARSAVAIHSLATDAVALVSNQLAGRGIVVDVVVPPGLTVRGDAVGLRHLLLNLLKNAIDACDGPGRIEVRATLLAPAEQRGAQVELSVRDHGRGMSPEELRRAFEPFYTTKAAGRGTGLGLMIVEQIVHAHGGHLKVDSVPGEGTIMRVFLPVEV